jgi:hypothetical protein
VRVHSLTLSFIPDFLLALNLASLRFGHEPKARVVIVLFEKRKEPFDGKEVGFRRKVYLL